MLFPWFIFLIVCQRAIELSIARRHEKTLKRLGATEYDHKGYWLIVGMHSAFIISIALEKFLFDRHLNPFWPGILLIFAGAQFLRYWAIRSLGIYWNTKILVAPDHPRIVKGPYRFMRHPNYVAVITEFIVIPFLFSCYFTAVVFTILNAFALRRRIRMETVALAAARRWNKKGRTELPSNT